MLIARVPMMCEQQVQLAERRLKAYVRVPLEQMDIDPSLGLPSRHCLEVLERLHQPLQVGTIPCRDHVDIERGTHHAVCDQGEAPYGYVVDSSILEPREDLPRPERCRH